MRYDVQIVVIDCATGEHVDYRQMVLTSTEEEGSKALDQIAQAYLATLQPAGASR